MPEQQFTAMTPEMRVAGNEFYNYILGANTQVKTIDSTMVQLQRDHQGPTGQKFQSAMNLWMTNYRTLVTELDGMKDTLLGNAAGYDQTEYTNVELMSDIFKALDDIV